MTARLIDGKALSDRTLAALRPRIDALVARSAGPGLAVVLVGDDPASAVYVRNKVRTSLEAGIVSVAHRLPAATTETELFTLLDTLNADRSVHGILLQLPLPPHLDAQQAVARISPDKDVDGLTIASAGALFEGHPRFRPCTPYGVMRILESIDCTPRGRHAVVLGRSILVGRPMAMLLLNADATVTVAHSRTADLAAVTRSADILVAAVGRRDLVTADMVKPGAVVIDVGMNRNDAGKLCGDVDFAAVSEVASAITPVPGGVGPMTIAMLMTNTVEAAERAAA
jgi:methylenetetrahydrofolate dehydrogenase (NADP+)/methenyltetrahydrofolate cyclohydrolase